MAYANVQAVVAKVYAALGRPSQQKLPARDVHASRVEAGFEILRAIAANPQNGHYGPLSELVAVAHDDQLPAHDGEMGIPVITLFDGGPVVAGKPADPDEIDSWRSDVFGVYTGALDGVFVPHDQADAAGLPSQLAGFYSVVAGRFKFTGHSAEVPVVRLTREKAGEQVPEVYEPTLVKLTIAGVLKGGRLPELVAAGAAYEAAGREDLMLIKQGEAFVPPVPKIVLAQKTAI